MWFGIIRPQKGLESLADVLEEQPELDVRLHILRKPLADPVSGHRRASPLLDSLVVDRFASDEEICAGCSIADAQKHHLSGSSAP